MTDRRDPFFRGFITLDGKAASMKFKDVPAERLLPEDVADSLGDYAGILADDVVVIDIDDAGQAAKMLDAVKGEKTRCRVYGTDRGMHFLFHNDGSIRQNQNGATIACGFKADVKCGSRNSYIVRKHDGKVRPLVYGDEVGDIPCWARPVRNVPQFPDMSEGDGRNSAMFSYILKLQQGGFSRDEVRKTLSVINEHVLGDRLKQGELDTIMREGAFQRQSFYDSKNKFLFDDFARYMIQKHHIVRISGRLHIWNGYAYIPNDAMIERKMIEEIPRLKKQDRNEAMDYISLLLVDSEADPDPRYVAFRNGIYDIDEDRMLPLSPDIVVTNPIPHCYIAGAYDKFGDGFLDRLSCEDAQIRQILEEAIGYPFLRKNELRKSFLLYGGKSNGKSTFLDIIHTILGDDNIVSMDLRELGERFKTSQFFEVLANIGDDIADDFINDLAIFKKLVSGDRLNAERKGQDPFDFAPYAKLFFSANTLPRLKDRTGSVIDRMIIIPFEAEFGADKPDYDPFIKYKLRKEETIEYFISLGIKGLRRVLMNNSFTRSGKVDSCLRAYDAENNNVLGWIDVTAPDIENHTVMEVYQRYREFCQMSNILPMSAGEFSKQMRRRCGYVSKVERMNGRPQRIFIADPTWRGDILEPDSPSDQLF